MATKPKVDLAPGGDPVEVIRLRALAAGDYLIQNVTESVVYWHESAAVVADLATISVWHKLLPSRFIGLTADAANAFYVRTPDGATLVISDA